MPKESSNGLITKPQPPTCEKRKVTIDLLASDWEILDQYQERAGVDVPFFVAECVRRQLASSNMQQWMKDNSATSRSSH